MPTTNKFAFAVLKRLAIAEATTALLVCEPRHDNAWSSAEFAVVSVIADLSALIGAAHAPTLKKQPSKSSIKNMAMSSARCVLPPFGLDHEVGVEIKKYLEQKNKKIIEAVQKYPLMAELEIIKNMLIQAFPAIDKDALNSAIGRLNEAINQLRVEQDGDYEKVEQDSDYEKVDAKNLKKFSTFAKANPCNVADTQKTKDKTEGKTDQSRCVIC